MKGNDAVFPRNPCGGAVHHFSCHSHYLSHYFFYSFHICPPPTLSASDAFFISSAQLSVFLTVSSRLWHVILLLALLSHTRLNCTLFASFWLWVLPILSPLIVDDIVNVLLVTCHCQEPHLTLPFHAYHYFYLLLCYWFTTSSSNCDSKFLRHLSQSYLCTRPYSHLAHSRLIELVSHLFVYTFLSHSCYMTHISQSHLHSSIPIYMQQLPISQYNHLGS